MVTLRFNFEKKVRLFFLAMVLAIIFTATISFFTFYSVTKNQANVINEYVKNVLLSQEAQYMFEGMVSKSRLFVITGDISQLEEYESIHIQFLKFLEDRKQHINSARDLELYTDIVETSQQYFITMNQLLGERKAGQSGNKVSASFTEKAGVILKTREAMQAASIYDLQQFKDAAAIASENRNQGNMFLEATIFLSIISFAVFYWFLSRLLWNKKEADEKLRISTVVLKQALIVGNLGIFDHNQRTDQIYWSPELRKICGWSPDEFVTLPDWIGHIPVEERAAVGTAIQRAHDPVGDGLYNIEHRIIRRDGTIRWVKIKSQTFFEGEGTDRAPAQTIGAMLDITEKKNFELELAFAKDAAEAANLAKSSFLANMSHEIRTPLGAVLGFAELITDPKEGPSQTAFYIAAIKRNSELLSNVINDILDLSKIEANKMNFDINEVALTEILTDAKTLLDLKAKEKGISLNITIDQTVPEIIKTDSLRLRQILNNIIGNAIKFTSKGSVDVSISKSIENAQDLLQFVVKDTGQGISLDEAEKLFVPFSQVDSTSKRKFGGTGLGLVISKRFANLLGGDLVLTKTVSGEGSIFTITIDPGPILPAHLASESKPELTEAHGESPPLDGIKILLVEDSPDNQVLISRLLTLAGASVDTASDGQEAVEKAKKNNYDVLLMDLQMPVMDGYEATVELRKKGYSGKIIALTAHALSEERERCLKSGFNDHIVKPINRELLIQQVEHWARQKNAPQVVDQ